MQADIRVFDVCFDATLEQVQGVVSDYLDKLVDLIPEAVLEVSLTTDQGKQTWIGKLSESKAWGKQDPYYGYIEAFPKYHNSDTPVIVRLYCAHPNYISYWGGMGITLQNRLKESDGSPGTTNVPWMLVPNIVNDREILRLWHQGYSTKEIAKHFGNAPKTISNRISKLRLEHGEVIVPIRKAKRKQKKSGYTGN